MKGFLALFLVIIFFYLLDKSLWFFLLAPVLATILALLCDDGRTK
jgi:hypothetical protein